MHAWLSRFLPAAAANLVAALWYALLLFMIYGLWQAPQAVFRYIMI